MKRRILKRRCDKKVQHYWVGRKHRKHYSIFPGRLTKRDKKTEKDIENFLEKRIQHGVDITDRKIRAKKNYGMKWGRRNLNEYGMVSPKEKRFRSGTSYREDEEERAGILKMMQHSDFPEEYNKAERALKRLERREIEEDLTARKRKNIAAYGPFSGMQVLGLKKGGGIVRPGPVDTDTGKRTLLFGRGKKKTILTDEDLK